MTRTRDSRVLNLVVGIENFDVLRTSTVVLEMFGVPVITHSALPVGAYLQKRYAHRSLHWHDAYVARPLQLVYQLGQDERFEAKFIWDIADKFNRSRVGIVSPRTRQALAIYSLLTKELGKTKPVCLDAATALFRPNDRWSVYEAASKMMVLPFIKASAVILLGDLEISLPFIEALSDRIPIDRLVWITTSAWGKHVWNTPLNDPKYQVVAKKMRHVFFPLPVPEEAKGGVQESWDIIENGLQERLRNADHLPQENNPWFERAWRKTTETVCGDHDHKAGNQKSKFIHLHHSVEFSEVRKACSLKGHHFPLHRSLFLMDAFFSTATVLERMYKRVLARVNCTGNDQKMCFLINQVRATPDGWFNLSETEKENVTRFVGLDKHSLPKRFLSESTRKNVNTMSKVLTKYKVLYITPSRIQNASSSMLPLTLAYWTPEGGFSDANINPHGEGLTDTIASLDPLIQRVHVCPPGTFQDQDCATKDNTCCWKVCFNPLCAKQSFQLWYPGGQRLKVISFSWSWVKSPSKCFSYAEPTTIIASRDEKRCNASVQWTRLVHSRSLRLRDQHRKCHGWLLFFVVPDLQPDQRDCTATYRKTANSKTVETSGLGNRPSKLAGFLAGFCM